MEKCIRKKNFVSSLYLHLRLICSFKDRGVVLYGISIKHLLSIGAILAIEGHCWGARCTLLFISPPDFWILRFGLFCIGSSKGSSKPNNPPGMVRTCKNLGRFWHAYIRSSGRFYMLQFISVDSGHFTQPELSLQWSDSHEIKNLCSFHGHNIWRFWRTFLQRIWASFGAIKNQKESWPFWFRNAPHSFPQTALRPTNLRFTQNPCFVLTLIF